MALALTWSLAAAVVFAARTTKPTPAAVLASLRQGETAPSGASLAAKMNRLTFDERETVKHSPEYRDAYQHLPPAEKARYLTATVPIDVRQTLDAIAAMPDERRRAFLDEAAQQADANNFDLGADAIAKERIRQIGEDALRDYLEHADPAARENLMPVLEQARKYLRMW